MAVSPDGKNLVFTSYTQKGRNKSVHPSDECQNEKDETIISNGKDFAPLIDAQPQFSKDGSIIYFMAEAKGAKRLKDETGRNAKVRTIYAYHLDTKNAKKSGKMTTALSTVFRHPIMKNTQRLLGVLNEQSWLRLRRAI